MLVKLPASQSKMLLHDKHEHEHDREVDVYKLDQSTTHVYDEGEHISYIQVIILV